MDIIREIKNLEKQKEILNRKLEKIVPKYHAIEKEFHEISDALTLVDGALTTITSSVHSVVESGVVPLAVAAPARPQRTTLRDDVVTFLKEKPNVSAMIIRTELDAPRVERYLKELVDSDRISRTRKGITAPYIYYLSPEQWKEA